MNTLTVGKFQISWLNGGLTRLDGGSMFGVVPKSIWSKKYSFDENNRIPCSTSPMLIQTGELNILVDAGLGNKMDDRQKRNNGVVQESKLEEDLQALGLAPDQIDIVFQTHMHADHASGLTKYRNQTLVPTFKNAKHIIQEIEWDEVRNPNIRSKNTYWKENWEPIKDLVTTFQDEMNIASGIDVYHTGGHSAGHSIIRLESNKEIAYHFGDILATHAHKNPLWVMAYDDYPMDSIFAKQKWINQALEENAWFLFYHDYFYQALKWNDQGEVINELKRN